MNTNSAPSGTSVPFVDFSAMKTALSAAEIMRGVSSHGVPMPVCHVNWPDFPYAPSVTAYMAHDGRVLYCLFCVSETHLRVETLHDNGPVWEDSCVELFVADPDGEHYYNFETNAAGTALASRRLSRTEYCHFSPEQMLRIIRHSSLPHAKTDNVDDGGIEWQLLVAVPFDLMGYDKAPASLRLNLYKCGDKTRAPHFLSWAPVATDAPDFHRPEFFAGVSLRQPDEHTSGSLNG